MASSTRIPGRYPRANSRPTQKDIARAAGVSQAAVSLVLNKAETPSVPDATRARILKLAGEMRYQPNHPARMLLQIHDELLFDVPEDEIDVVRALVKREMESVLELNVPIVADVGIGQNWRDLKG